MKASAEGKAGAAAVCLDVEQHFQSLGIPAIGRRYGGLFVYGGPSGGLDLSREAKKHWTEFQELWQAKGISTSDIYNVLQEIDVIMHDELGLCTRACLLIATIPCLTVPGHLIASAYNKKAYEKAKVVLEKHNSTTFHPK